MGALTTQARWRLLYRSSFRYLGHLVHTFEAGFETKELQGLKWLVLALSVLCFIILVSISCNDDLLLEAHSLRYAHVRGIHGILLL